jgi:hypothetical protein
LKLKNSYNASDGYHLPESIQVRRSPEPVSKSSDIGDVQGKAFTLWWIGGIAYEKGDLETALTYLAESFEIFERIGSPEAEKVKGILDEVIKLSESGFTGLKDERD